jgi:hypothetical protein
MNLEQPDSRDEAREMLESNIDAGSWDNFGDARPGPHGGMWCKYDADRGEFDCHVTYRAAEMGLDADPDDVGDQYVMSQAVDWRDLIADDGTLTDWLHGELDSVSGAEPDIMHLLAEEVDLRAHAVCLARETARRRRVEGADYDDVLNQIGVDPDDD